MLKPLTVWIVTDHGKLLKRQEYQTILPVSWETYLWVKKQYLEHCMEQLTGSGLRKEYDKAVYCHPVYLTYTQLTSWEGWWVTNWNQDWREKYQQPQICGWYHSMGREWTGTSLLMRVKKESAKDSLKANIKKKLRSWHHFMANRRGKGRAVMDFLLLGSKITVDGDCSHEIRRWLLLGRKSTTNLDYVLTSKGITLPTKVHVVKTVVFPVVMYRGESSTVKTEFQRIDALQL